MNFEVCAVSGSIKAVEKCQDGEFFVFLII